MRSLYEVDPFGNTMVVVEMTGKDLEELLQNAAKDPSRGLEISGGKAKFAAGKIQPRLVSLEIGGAKVAADRKYKVVTNSFLATGGDGHVAFKTGAQRDTYVAVRDALAEYFRKGGKCKADATARIHLP
jgi:2',3'-cyclic-nucleotide 2'-phosphodiesterase (5'-nucleotidase family)